MAVCDPSLNAAVPAWLTPLASAGIAVTPAMQAWAASFANDLSVPQNSVATKWFGSLPIAALTSCHTYTVINGQNVPGLYHGTSLYLVNDPAHYPPLAGAPSTSSPPETIDWPAVAVSGAALGAVVALFVIGLRKAARAVRG